MLSVTYALLLWTIVSTWAVRRATSGRILLDLGRARGSNAMTLLGVVLLALAFFPGPENGTATGTRASWSELAAALRLFSAAAYCLVTGRMRTEIREGGISGGLLFYPHFVAWERVASYALAGRVLAITVARRWHLPFLRPTYHLHVLVPPDRAADVEAAMRPGPSNGP